jgi:hypothetical protein
MKASVLGGSSLKNFVAVLHRYRLFVACLVVVMCFALAGDVYAAKKVADRHKDLLGPRRVIDYSEAVRRQQVNEIYRTKIGKAYLVDPKAAKQPTIMASLMSGSDTCGQLTTAIKTIPFNDGTPSAPVTTVGQADNYDISGDPTACPAPTCEATSGPFSDRGYTYAGTGTGPDVAYRIRFKQPANLQIVLDPTDPPGTADDLALIFYGQTCSNNPADAIVVADNSADGNPPDLADNSETITITNLPLGIYNIVVDAYTYAGAAAATAGPYTLSVTCAPGFPTCTQPVNETSRFSR